MSKHKNKALYVVNNKFHLVHYNDELQQAFPKAEKGKCCFDALFQRKVQCDNCPLRDENKGAAVLFDEEGDKWIRLCAIPVAWPDAGDCTLISAGEVLEDEAGYFYNTFSDFDYNELLKLNYQTDAFAVVEHAERKKTTQINHGKMSRMIRQVAEHEIHPDDRERFYDFWQLEKVGRDDIPSDSFMVRHGEFRKQKPDGNYELVQQMLVPVRQTTKNDIFVMSFYNVIKPPEELEQEFSSFLNTNTSVNLSGKKRFFERVKELIEKSADDIHWSMIAIDIENFKVFNTWYGEEKGTELLNDIAALLKNKQADGSNIAGYLGNDDFAFFTPYDKDQIEHIYSEIVALIQLHSKKISVLPALGVYEVTGKQEQIFTIYDRAKIACTAVKGNYADRIKYFDEQMLTELESGYVLFSDIQTAFANHEFTFYLQPKCNLITGKIIGSEALVRWEHPEKGMISPGVFIPFLEKSGLISQLDIYIWEEVCKWLRMLLDRGQKVLPVSVNVSKIDLYAIDVPTYFNDLVKKYHIDPRLLEIEITESVYAADDAFIDGVVTKLRKSGFRILLDDFGKEYSALSMLYDVKVDVLKLDMRFMGFNTQISDRSIRFLESIYGMAQTLGMHVLAEGIETEEQKIFLQKMGCRYGQGFYFYRPLSVFEFEKLLKNDVKLDFTGLRNDQNIHILPEDLLSRNFFNEHMIDRMLGAVAVYDVYEDQITVKRYNERYASLLGYDDFYSGNQVELRFGELIYKEEHHKIFEMFEKAYHNPDTSVPALCDVRRRKPDGTDIWLHVRMFFMNEIDGHRLYYGTSSDVTSVYRKNEMLQFFLNDTPGAYYCHKNSMDGEFFYISQKFLELFGYTEDEIKNQFDNKFSNMVHPDDRIQLRGNMDAAGQEEGNYKYTYRMLAKGGYLTVTDQCRLTKYEDDEFFQGVILYDNK